MKWYRLFVRGVILFGLLVLTGCATYHQSYCHAQNLQTLKPHYVAVAHGQIEYYQFGHGQPIILLAGYGADISSWNQEFLQALAVNHQVIVLNNRNVGGSIIKSSHYESQDLANDTYQLIKKLHLKKPIVLGISMGGMIAQQVAVLHEKNIGKLILINTAIAGKRSIHPNQNVKYEMLNMPANKLRRYLLALDLFFPSSWRMEMAYELIVDRFQPRGYQEINAAVLPQQRRFIDSWAKDNVTGEKMHQLKLPVLILNGKADQVIPPENSVILFHSVAHAKLLRWQNGGHAMIYQYPLQIVAAINAF